MPLLRHPIQELLHPLHRLVPARLPLLAFLGLRGLVVLEIGEGLDHEFCAGAGWGRVSMRRNSRGVAGDN